MNPFDWSELPLSGARLVEASAGTGKTWAIAALYIRLLLGHGSPATRHPRGPLPVRDVLVVTFTIAATNELRERIRGQLRTLRGDPGVLHPLRVDDPGLARLELALTELDEARIYTIHGFCQQVLRAFPVECGVPWQWDYVIDDGELWRQVVNDFWRREVVPFGRGERATERIAVRVLNTWWPSPDDLGKEIGRLRIRPGAILLGGETDPDEALRAVLDAADDLARYWREHAVRAALADATALSAAKEKAGRAEVQDRFDRFAGEGLGVIDKPERFFAAFSSRAIGPGGEALKKRGEPCRDLGFLERVDGLLEALGGLRASLLRRAFEVCRESAAELHAATRELAPDDLVAALHAALRGPHGERLAARLRALWPAVMIDEFQDTDALQSDVFERIWRPGSDTLRVAIGDPKQSIFGFRGADLFSYVAARERLPEDARYTMTVNWRSTAGFITALNTLYGEARLPFVSRDVSYVPVAPSDAAPQEPPGAALRFLWVGTSDNKQGGSPTERLARAGAAEVAALIESGASPGDVAVIVRTRNEAGFVRTALAEVGLRAVYLSRDPVLGTEVARDVLRVLAAMLEPTVPQRLRAALASRLFEYELDALPNLLGGEAEHAEMLGRWREYLPLWREAGVLAALHRCLRDHGVVARLLARADGPRRLTDVRHIGELLEEQARLIPAPIGLQRWLAAAIEGDDTQNEERQLRLESDEGLVRVVTIHGAKGLEFDHVLLPFVGIPARSRRSGSDRFAIYHRDEPNAGYQLVASLAPDEAEREVMRQEARAEDARLLYVALTRARRQCIVGLCNSGEGFARSPLAYLLLGERDGVLDDDTIRARIDALARGSGGQIALEEARLPEETGHVRADQAPELPLGLAFEADIDRSWRVSSYTGLVGAATPSREVPGLADELGGEGAVLAAPPRDAAAAFPRGPRPGVALHELLERWPEDPTVAREQVRRMVAGLGYEGSIDAAFGWLTGVRSTPLAPLDVSLAELTSVSRELEFHMRSQRASTERLREVLRAAGMNDAPLAQAELTGLVRGFIDLVFHYDGRFYLVDYKSNWLGPDAGYYDKERMSRVIAEHRYDLQLMIYATALRRHLRSAGGDELAGRYGGAFYLFLRGMDGSGERGVWFAPPDAELLRHFDEALG